MSVDVSEVTEATAVEVDTTETEQSDRASIAFTVPNELKALADAKADELKISTAAYVRGLVAREFSFVIPDDFGTRRKYASDAERIAATKEKAQKRNKLLNMLLAKYRAGEIDLNDLIGDDEE